MYLVDTNVWLERLLDQEKSGIVGRFLDAVPSEQLSITDFAFHSIGISLRHLKRLDLLLQFVRDAFVEGDVVFVHLAPEDTERLVRVMNQFGLDFDDAYQYVAASKHALTLVSFDNDFDRTDRGRKTPGEALASYSSG